MSVPWRHPKNERIALLGLLLDCLSFILMMCSVEGTPWFVNYRPGMGDTEYYYFDLNVDCTDDTCFPAATPGKVATWQMVASVLIVVSLGIQLTTLGIQMLVFWPFSIKGKIHHSLLKLIAILLFISGYSRYIGAFIYIHHSPKINNNFAWDMSDHILELKSGPLSLVLFSFILEVLAILTMIIVLDEGARGGLTHRDRLKVEQSLMDKEAFIRRHSHLSNHAQPVTSYQPKNEEAQIKLLTKVRESMIDVKKTDLRV